MASFKFDVIFPIVFVDGVRRGDYLLTDMLLGRLLDGFAGRLVGRREDTEGDRYSGVKVQVVGRPAEGLLED